MSSQLNPRVGGLSILAVAVAAVLGASSLACMNECSFIEQCNGNVREVCGGVDQQVNRSVQEYPCEDPNPICVEVEDQAICTPEDSMPCDRDTFEPSCDGQMLIVCDVAGVTTRRDCTVSGPSCVVTNTGATCATDPPVACNPNTFDGGCLDGASISCTGGWRTSTPCPGECEELETGGSYCPSP